MLLPGLCVRGNQIVERESGNAVLLRGVNRSGLEYSPPDGAGSLAKAGISQAELAHIVTDWKANIVRLPFNQEWALARPGYDAEPYLAALDFVIETLAQQGAYTLLDLQWLDAHTPRGRVDGRPNFVAPLPDAASVELWQQLANRWKSNPAVLFDIFNEPHHLLPDDHEPIMLHTSGETKRHRGRRVGAKEWHGWAQHLVRTIRAVHPEALIFVSGLDWGYDLSSFPLADVTGVVYSTHVYPSKGGHWDRAFGKLSRTVPVFAAEWGGGLPDLAWGRRLAAYFREHSIGWTAWSWLDHPHLVQGDLPCTPTEFGRFVRAELRREDYDITGSTFLT